MLYISEKLNYMYINCILIYSFLEIPEDTIEHIFFFKMWGLACQDLFDIKRIQNKRLTTSRRRRGPIFVLLTRPLSAANQRVSRRTAVVCRRR